MPAKPRRETDLYLPVKNLFAGRNYKIRAEVNGCDLVAVKDQEMVIVELKTSVNIRLLTQAVERLSITPMVYIAVPEPSRKRNSHWRGIIKLLKMLGLGLILVTFGPAGARAGIAFDPGARQPSRNIKKIKNLKREFEGRSADHNTGGSNRSPLMTSYKECAILIACFLEERESASPRELKSLGTGEKTASILQKNHYGWFERLERGIYRITDKGRQDIKQFPEIRTKFCASTHHNDTLHEN